LTCGIDLPAATKLHKAYNKLNWAWKQVCTEQKYKTVNGQMWLQNPINKFWYSLRGLKDIGSTLVQGSASYVFDMWVKLILEKRRQLTSQFHDEIVLEIKEGFEDKAKELVTSSINKLNEILGLNRELGISVQFGKRYSEIH